MRVGIFGNKATTVDLAKRIAPAVSELVLISLEEEVRNRAGVAGALENLSDMSSIANFRLVEVSDYSLRNSDCQLQIRELGLDLGLTYGWQRLLPHEVLRSFKHGVFGWHGSPFRLPYGRGRSPINWALRLGQQSFFHYLFRLREGADTGPIFDLMEIPIDPDDYIGHLLAKAHLNALRGSALLIEAARLGTILTVAQPQHQELWLPRLSPSDAILEPNCMTVSEALRIVRASSRPFPGAVLSLNVDNTERELIVWRARVSPHSEAEDAQKVPGLTVSFLDGSVLIEESETRT